MILPVSLSTSIVAGHGSVRPGSTTCSPTNTSVEDMSQVCQSVRNERGAGATAGGSSQSVESRCEEIPARLQLYQESLMPSGVSLSCLGKGVRLSHTGKSNQEEQWTMLVIEIASSMNAFYCRHSLRHHDWQAREKVVAYVK